MPPIAALYFGLSILASILWWGTPLGWLLVLSTIQDTIAYAHVMGAGWNERLHAMKVAQVGVEMFFVVVIIALAAGDNVDEITLAIAGPLWALLRARGEKTNIYTVNIEREIFYKLRIQLQIVAEMGVLGSLFVLWRGLIMDGVSLLIYSSIALVISMRYDNVELRRYLATTRVFLLAVLGIIRIIMLYG